MVLRMSRTDRPCSRQRAVAFPALSPAAFARAPHRLLFPLDPWGRSCSLDHHGLENRQFFQKTQHLLRPFTAHAATLWTKASSVKSETCRGTCVAPSVTSVLGSLAVGVWFEGCNSGCGPFRMACTASVKAKMIVASHP